LLARAADDLGGIEDRMTESLVVLEDTISLVTRPEFDVPKPALDALKSCYAHTMVAQSAVRLARKLVVTRCVQLEERL